ncbi:MAG: hypothetical protein ABSA77_01225, partial [Thermoguttaceae bacterium]
SLLHDLPHLVVLVGVGGHVDAHGLAGSGHRDRLVVQRDRVDLLGEVTGVALDVEGVAPGQRLPLDLDCRHADLAEIMGYFAEFHFCHRTALLLWFRVRPDVAAAQIGAGERQLGATVASDPVPKVKQRNVEPPPTAEAGNCHGNSSPVHFTTRRPGGKPGGEGGRGKAVQVRRAGANRIPWG